MGKLTQFLFTEKGNQTCIYVVESANDLTPEEKNRLEWILDENQGGKPPEIENIKFLVGPNLRFETPESEKFRKIFSSFGLKHTQRVEEFVVHKIYPGYDAMMEFVYNKIPSTLMPIHSPEPTKIINLIQGGKTLFSKINKDFGMGMDDFDMDYYLDFFVNKYRRNPTDVELMQVAQGNSSHCRHWEFGGKFFIDGKEMDKTLFQMVKETLKQNPRGSIKAFKDNGGILKGGMVNMFIKGLDDIYRTTLIKMNHTATGETHNHPSMISPYPGAATGVGGRLRDTDSIGRGSLIGMGGVYFHTGKLWLNQEAQLSYPEVTAWPRLVLIGAIKGASGYGNPYGEATTMFENDAHVTILPNGQRFENIKPNIYTCGIGSIPAGTEDKAEAEHGLIIVRIGGATRRIGVGGGAASSIDGGNNKAELDFASVQRGEPLMGRSAYNVIEECIFMGEKNPIEAIHDQGAGGASNVITELVNPSGGSIDLARMQIADASLSQAEIWVAESQELHGFLIKPKNLEKFKAICAKYECPIEILGETNGTERIIVCDSRDGSTPVNLPLPEILGNLPQKTYKDDSVELKFTPLDCPKLSVEDHLKNVARVPGVAFLNYMVDHFDGSVGGRIVQGPRDGQYQLPICKYAVMSDGLSGVTGVVSTISRTSGIAMLINEEAASRMVVGQMLATLSFVHIPGGIEHIKGRLNVMWPFKQPGMKAKLYSAYKAVTDMLKEVGFGIDGGKDSSSFSVHFEGNTVMSFPTFVLLPYAHMSDIRSRVTPAIKSVEERTNLILIELEPNKHRLGGSALAEAYEQTGNEVPDADPKKVKILFGLMQRLVQKKKILAGSTKVKGGLLATVAKMSVSSDVKVRIDNPYTSDPYNVDFYFNEEIGVVVQCLESDTKYILGSAKNAGLSANVLGHVNAGEGTFTFCDRHVVDFPSAETVRGWFSETGKEIKKYLGIPSSMLENIQPVKQNYKLTFNPDEDRKLPEDKKFRVAVLAAPGTNGHHELAFMFGRMKKQFEVRTIQMSQLLTGEYDLKYFNVIAWAGGFSYGDVGGSGKGWAASILFNEKLKKMFDDFYARPDTLSFGVCNGFQVATLLGLLDTSLCQQPRLIHNDSGMFEHRPVNLLIPYATRSIMFDGMGGSILPAWSAHGEGKLFLPDLNYRIIENLGLVAVSYVDSDGKKTTEYPANPNGSPLGIAGLCTKDGRHTFMMPHIERFASNNHLPYRPKNWKFKTPVWAKAVENMYFWLYENVKS